MTRPTEQQVDFAELQERIRQQQLACHNQQIFVQLVKAGSRQRYRRNAIGDVLMYIVFNCKLEVNVFTYRGTKVAPQKSQKPVKTNKQMIYRGVKHDKAA